uniref:Uncharacterized protein n=1 Tax=Cucumis sativus TaxID=3659 RepID=A0A0A0KPS9_CUCSA
MFKIFTLHGILTNFLQPQSDRKSRYWKLTMHYIYFLKGFVLMVQNLYYMNARRTVYRDENAACTEDINDMVIEFNFSMRYTVKELGTELHHSSIILCDLLRVSMDILKDHICVLQGSMD